VTLLVVLDELGRDLSEHAHAATLEPRPHARRDVAELAAGAAEQVGEVIEVQHRVDRLGCSHHVVHALLELTETRLSGYQRGA
jgi:hypothetical protein